MRNKLERLKGLGTDSNKVSGVSTMEVLVIIGAFVIIAVVVFLTILKPATEDMARTSIDNAKTAIEG